MQMYFANAPELGLFTILETDVDGQGRRLVRYRRRNGTEGLTLARSVVIIME